MCKPALKFFELKIIEQLKQNLTLVESRVAQ